MDPSEPISLLICDDHKVLTDALSMVIDRQDGFRLVSPPVHDPAHAIVLCGEHHPDVVLMDLEFKGDSMDGLDATRQIKDVSPTTKVVVMTAHRDERLLVDAVQAGASAFLGKDEPADEVLRNLRAAAEGEALVDPETLSRLLHQVTLEREERREIQALFASLTDREWEVLRGLALGKRNDDIAAELFISPQTVQTHIRNVLGKLNVHSKLEAVALAVRHRQIEI